jgi:transposase, IS30 family
MGVHAMLSVNMRIDVFFANAHGSRQKGTIDKANGLLRQYLPKGTNLASHA